MRQRSTVSRSVHRVGVTAATLLLVLAPAGAVADTLVGQVVCSQCWTEADRERVPYGTPADLDCAVRCAKQGIEPAFVVRNDERFELYRLSGAPPDGGAWLDWTGRFARAEGRVYLAGETARFDPVSLEALAASPWPEPERAGHDVELAWTDLRGRPTGLEMWRERIVVVNFWATWCRPCIEEMPDLVALHDKFAPYGVEFIGASADDPGDVENVLAYVRKHRINFPIVLGATTEQMQGLGLPPVLPGTVIFDEHGHPAERFPGVIDPAEVEATLSRLLGLGDGAGTLSARARPGRGRGAPRNDHHQSHASLVPS